jgi:hypothetical protein
MLTDATRELALDMLAEIDLDELTEEEAKKLLAALEQVTERHAAEGRPPVAYEESLAAEIDRRRGQRGLGPGDSYR